MKQPIRVAGSIILEQLEVARKEYGSDVVDRALASLPPPLDTDISELLAVSWLDGTTAMLAKNAIAEAVGRPPLDFQKWVVHAAVGKTIPKFWRFLLSKVSDGAIVKRAPILYSKTFDRGALVVMQSSPFSTDLEVRGYPDLSDYDATGLSAGIAAVMEYLDRKDVHVSFTRAPTGIHFKLTWK